MGRSIEETDKILEMWKKGHSHSQIARYLSNGTSRSAVAGVLFRNGAPLRNPEKVALQRIPGSGRRPSVQKQAKKVTFRKRKSKHEKPEPKPLPSGEFVTTLTLERGLCCFPHSGSGADTTYCGNTASVKHNYCPYHDDITHATPQEIKEESARLWNNKKAPKALRLNSPLRGT